MKTAVLDIGNTRTKAAIFENGIQRKLIFPTFTGVHPEAKDFFSGVSRVVLGSVVPEIQLMWKDFFSSLEVIEINNSAPWAFSIKVENPQSIGIDRLANMEAVSSSREPVVVVDAGTATKWDLLSTNENKPWFEGGAIAPGVRLSAEALLQRGARLPQPELIEKLFSLPGNIPVVGKSTQGALAAGIVKSFVIQVDGMLALLFAENTQLSQCRVVATGGNSFLLKERSRLIQDYREDLTLEGLYAVAQKF